MNKEEAIESFKYSNEQAKVRLEVEKMRMDMDEVKELEFYIERDEMAIKALEQMPVTTTTGGSAVIYYPQVEGVTPTVVDAGKQDPCDTCGYEEGSIYCKEHCPYEAKIEQESCEDAISRQAVLDIVDSYSESRSNVEDVTQDMISDIVVLPSVTPQPKTGHWIKFVVNGQHKIRCDKCDYIEPEYATHIRNYCPNCGCRMVEQED